MNPVNCEPINLDTSLTQDLQENVESIQSVSIVTTITEGKVDDYSIQHSVISPHEENIQNIDIYDMVEMPDISTRITDDEVLEEFIAHGNNLCHYICGPKYATIIKTICQKMW